MIPHIHMKYDDEVWFMYIFQKNIPIIIIRCSLAICWGRMLGVTWCLPHLKALKDTQFGSISLATKIRFMKLSTCPKNPGCPEERITPWILLWGWDWNLQSYSTEGSASLGLCLFKQWSFHPGWLGCIGDEQKLAIYIGVSKNRGTPCEWMVYNGTPY